MTDPVELQPWNDAKMTADLLELVPRLCRIRLDRLDPPNSPGCYLQFFATSKVEPVLGELIATGRYVAYIGVAANSLRERIGRYRQSVAGVRLLEEQDLYLSLVSCSSTASARFAEAALLTQLAPVLNGLGWGSRLPGRHRMSQAVSPVDALMPGRRWAHDASVIDEARARMKVISHLVRLDPSGPRWPPLVTTSPSRRSSTSRPALHLIPSEPANAPRTAGR